MKRSIPLRGACTCSVIKELLFLMLPDFTRVIYMNYEHGGKRVLEFIPAIGFHSALLCLYGISVFETCGRSLT